jgi:phosphoesterase RecJ-like protein
VDVNAVYHQVYEVLSEARLRLLQRALSRMELRLGGALVTAWLTPADFAEFGADDSAAEGLIDTLRQMKGARVAALARERAGTAGVDCKVSLRSIDGTVNVADIAGRKGGGGHVRASGFTCSDGEGAQKTLAWVERQVKPLL